LKPESQNSELQTEDVLQRARRIKLLLMDCDGVLTDARIWLTPDGDEQKAFHARDGQGISVWHRAGCQSGIISGRASSGVERRAHELKIKYVHQYAKNKIVALEEIIADAGVAVDECCFIGDDLGDIGVMRRVGLAVAVADAADDTKMAAHYVTILAGGHAAVREVIELILKAQGRWDELVGQVTVH
jgi:3-deoxy-D-manno-octulosonate 8-phosphate phosphatase (KDO 8-P phosphatase)